MALAGFGDRVEGIHAVGAAASAGRVERLHVDRRRQDHPSVAPILAAVGHDRVTAVDDIGALADTGVHQGLVAECRPLMSVTLESLASPEAALVVLDHVEDPHNVGAVARSARAAGMSGMVVSSRRAAPLSAAAFKAAAGALEALPLAIVGSIPDALKRLRDLEVWTVGLDPSAEQSLFGLELLTEPVAVVVGGEGAGLSRLAAQRCDMLAAIPMSEGTESLNVSVTAALAVFEIMRVRVSRPG